MKTKQTKYTEAINRNVDQTGIRLHVGKARDNAPSQTATELLPKVRHSLGVRQNDEQFDGMITAEATKQIAAYMAAGKSKGKPASTART